MQQWVCLFPPNQSSELIVDSVTLRKRLPCLVADETVPAESASQQTQEVLWAAWVHQTNQAFDRDGYRSLKT